MHVDPGLDQVGRHRVRPRAGVLVHEPAGVGDQPHVQRLGDLQGGLDSQALHQVPHDLGRARRLGQHVVDRAEAGVVVVVVDVDDARSRPPERLGRISLEVAAVEEHDRALLEVLGRRLHQPGEREEAILLRQRKLAAVDEHQAVAALRLEDLLHRDQRPERVAVDVLVRDDDQLPGRAELGHHLVPGCRRCTVVTHPRRAALIDQARDPHASIDRLVVLEGDRRRVLERQLGRHAPLEEPVGRAQAVERLGTRLLVPQDAYVHARMAQIGAGLDGGHGHEAYAGILEILAIASLRTARTASSTRRIRPSPILATPPRSWDGRAHGHSARSCTEVTIRWTET